MDFEQQITNSEKKTKHLLLLIYIYSQNCINNKIHELLNKLIKNILE